MINDENNELTLYPLFNLAQTESIVERIDKTTYEYHKMYRFFNNTSDAEILNGLFPKIECHGTIIHPMKMGLFHLLKGHAIVKTTYTPDDSDDDCWFLAIDFDNDGGITINFQKDDEGMYSITDLNGRIFIFARPDIESLIKKPRHCLSIFVDEFQKYLQKYKSKNVIDVIEFLLKIFISSALRNILANNASMGIMAFLMNNNSQEEK